MKFVEAIIEAEKIDGYVAQVHVPLFMYRYDTPDQDVIYKAMQSRYWKKSGLQNLQPFQIIKTTGWTVYNKAGENQIK